MKKIPFVLRVYGERRNGQWSLVCLEFNVAAQADTLPQAKAKLHSMVVGYLNDALNGEDREYALDFLSRRAPVSFWVKYYFAKLCHCFTGNDGPRRLAENEPIPMAPVGA